MSKKNEITIQTKELKLTMIDSKTFSLDIEGVDMHESTKSLEIALPGDSISIDLPLLMYGNKLALMEYK